MRRKKAALLVAVALGAGSAGFAAAQTPTKPVPRKPVVKAVTAVGTVKTVAADSVVVTATAKGKEAEWTFAVDATTRIKKGGRDVTAVALVPGDQVNVRYIEQEGRTVARSITVTGPARREPEKKP